MIRPRGPRLPLVPNTYRTDSKLASVKRTQKQRHASHLRDAPEHLAPKRPA
jgi:hypothetical protein